MSPAPYDVSPLLAVVFVVVLAWAAWAIFDYSRTAEGKPCDICGGLGELGTLDGEGWADCPVCEGTGKLKP